MSILPCRDFFPQGTRDICSYGFDCCGYLELSEALQELGSRCSYRLAASTVLPEIVSPWEIPEKIFNYDDSDEKAKALAKKLFNNQFNASFKTCLINIVIENIKRERRGKAIIPVCFCVDINKSPTSSRSSTPPRWKPSPSPDLLKKSEDMKTYYTSSELRQAYKLCYEPSLGEEVNRVARKTFENSFVKVHIMEDNSIHLERLPPVWEGITDEHREQLVGVNHKRKPKNPLLIPKLHWVDQILKYLTDLENSSLSNKIHNVIALFF
jgi:hypothetical protein